MTERLYVNLNGLDLSTPIIAASGCYGYGVEYAEVADPRYLGGFVTKSVSPVRWAGNPPPRLCEVGPGLINSIGLANMGVKEFAETIVPRFSELDTRKIVSIAGKVQDDYLAVVDKLEQVEGIDGYELNISCPNVKEGGMAFSQNPQVTENMVKRVRMISNRWITAKLTPNVATVADGAKAAEAGGANAVSLINTLVGMAVDWRTRRPRIATVTGGYSGPPIKPIALAKVWEAAKAVTIPVIGMGGITSWTDVLEFMIVGASAVQVGTALYADPDVPRVFAEKLDAHIQNEGMQSITELVGTLDTQRPQSVGVPV
jgi:dihydroorotate dehydrogenase (NAD+) catalytic subunit